MEIIPNNFDEVTGKMNIDPLLVNPYLATTVDFSDTTGKLAEFGDTLYLPTHISPNRGRKSNYFVPKDERQPVGIIVPDADEVGVVFLTRLSGGEDSATEGDQYKLEIENQKREVIYSEEGQLTVTNQDTGEGYIEYGSGLTMGWIIFSAISKQGVPE